MTISKKYIELNNCLNSMIEEYKVLPSKFLLKKIELCKNQLKELDKLIETTKTPFGNYNHSKN